MMKDALDRVFENAGISDTQMESKVYKTVKQLVEEHPEVLISSVCGNLDGAIERAADLCEALRQQHGEALDEYIRDETKRDAVRVFGSALRIVQNTFGADKMTDEVITKAIEAASYMAYRAIMGEAATPYVKRV